MWSQSKKMLLMAVITILLVANVFVFERLIAQQSWSLFDIRKDFLDGKSTMGMPVIGSIFFLTGRAGITQGEIHLDRWYGNQEIRTAKIHSLKQFKFSGSLHEKGELIISWKKTDGKSEGIRVTSRGSDFFRTNQNGEWIETKALALKPVSGHHPSLLTRLSALSRNAPLPDRSLELTLLFSERSLKVFQDDKEISSLGDVSNTGYFSIQGNSYPVTIDEFSLINQQGNKLSENFEPPISPIFGVLLFGAMILIFVF